MAERDPSFSYLKLSAAQRSYLIQLITGKTDNEIRLELPSARTPSAGKAGVSQAMVRKWRERTPEFKYAERQARQEPMWVVINIGLPLLFAAQVEEDVRVMMGQGSPAKRPYLNARRLELLSLQLGLSNPEASSSHRSLTMLVNNMNLVLPELQPTHAETIDVTPVEHTYLELEEDDE